MALNPLSDSVATAVREICSHRGGVDVAFEMSGSEAVYPGIFDYIRREGTLVSVGHPGKPVSIDVAAYINKQGVVFKGVFGRRIWDTWEILSALVGAKRLDLTSYSKEHGVHMKAIRFVEPWSCRLEEVPEPEVGDGEILVRVAATGRSDALQDDVHRARGAHRECLLLRLPARAGMFIELQPTAGADELIREGIEYVRALLEESGS